MKKVKVLMLAGMSCAALAGLTAVNITPVVNAQVQVDTSQHFAKEYVSSVGINDTMHYYIDFDYTKFDEIATISYSKNSNNTISLNLKAKYSTTYQFADCFQQISSCQTVEDGYYEDYYSIDNNTGDTYGWNYIVESNGQKKYMNSLNTNVAISFDEAIGNSVLITIPLRYDYWVNDDYGDEQISYGSVTYRLIFKDSYKNIFDENDKIIYQSGGIGLGRNLSSSYVTSRYQSLNIIDAYEDGYAFAKMSQSYETKFDGYPCTIASLFGAVKGIELAHEFEDNSYALLGDKIGSGYKQNNNLYDYTDSNRPYHYWMCASNITLSGNNYMNTEGFPLAVETSNYNYLSYTYNEFVKLGYHVVNNGGGSFSPNKAGIEAYLNSEKSWDDYRYVLSQNDVYTVASAGEDLSFSRIEEYINKGIPVQIGDNDFKFVGDFATSSGGGHAMLGIGVGVTNDGVKEVIYDQGGGNYCAMPINDVHDYWLLDIKAQEKITIKHNILWWSYTETKWVDSSN